jgi:hypothetical protein
MAERDDELHARLVLFEERLQGILQQAHAALWAALLVELNGLHALIDEEGDSDG